MKAKSRQAGRTRPFNANTHLQLNLKLPIDVIKDDAFASQTVNVQSELFVGGKSFVEFDESFVQPILEYPYLL